MTILVIKFGGHPPLVSGTEIHSQPSIETHRQTDRQRQRVSSLV